MIRILVLLALLAGPAAAETRRVAVVVGNNTGNQAPAALRYAEVDASKLGRVLVELGGVAPGDLFLLKGRDLASLEDTLRRARAKIAAYRAQLDRVIIIFYYSGHSDGIALELGRDRFTFAALRDWLKDTAADVRVALVDSCKSGALLATKGGTPGPAFHIRLTDELSSSGEALLTSSAADENALESKEIGGSFFTHHLVSGLRGAADTSGDGRVTLNEAYQYAYKHTISTSAATLAGPQHPTYDYRLSGKGELVLTELARPTAGLALPDGFDRALVLDGHQQVIAELDRGDRATVALVPGRYAVRVWRAGQTLEGRVAVTANQVRAVAWSELSSTTLAASRAKGDLRASLDEPARVPLELTVAGGARRGVAEQVDALGSVRIAVRTPILGGATLALDASTRRDDGVRETGVFAFAGYRLGRGFGPVRGTLGLEVGGGMVRQSFGATQATGAAAIAWVGGLAIPIAPRVALALELQLPAMLVKRDGDLAITALPGAWLGVQVTP